MTGLLTPATFEPHVGTEFAIQLDDAVVMHIVLKSVERHPTRSHGDRIEPFSLTFVGPSGAPLPQAAYSIEHLELGVLVIFLVPIGPEGSGRQLYEAVFN